MYKELYHVQKIKNLHIRHWHWHINGLNERCHTFDSRSKSPDSFVLEDFTRDYEKRKIKLI